MSKVRGKMLKDCLDGARAWSNVPYTALEIFAQEAWMCTQSRASDRRRLEHVIERLDGVRVGWQGGYFAQGLVPLALLQGMVPQPMQQGAALPTQQEAVVSRSAHDASLPTAVGEGAMSLTVEERQDVDSLPAQEALPNREEQVSARSVAEGGAISPPAGRADLRGPWRRETPQESAAAGCPPDVMQAADMAFPPVGADASPALPPLPGGAACVDVSHDAVAASPLRELGGIVAGAEAGSTVETPHLSAPVSVSASPESSPAPSPPCSPVTGPAAAALVRSRVESPPTSLAAPVPSSSAQVARRSGSATPPSLVVSSTAPPATAAPASSRSVAAAVPEAGVTAVAGVTPATTAVSGEASLVLPSRALRECMICASDKVETRFLPCHHSIACVPCANRMRHQNERCPIDRSRIDDFETGHFVSTYPGT